MKSAIIIALFLLITFVDSFGQQFKYIRTQDGLYDGEINSIEQDSTGNMWFATWSGLISYDGIAFRSYRPEIGNALSLPDKKVKKLFVDSKDNLWIITSKGLSLYNKIVSSFINLEFEGFNNSTIDITFLSEVNGILIAQTNDGFYFLPINQSYVPGIKLKKISIFNGQKLIPTINYSISLAGNLILVANNEYLKSSDVYFASIDKNNSNPYINIKWELHLPEIINSVVYVEPENNLYMATNNGVVPISLTERKPVKERFFPKTEIRQIIFTSDYKLYCSSDKAELLYIDLHIGATGRYEANSNNSGTLLNDNINSLYEDFSGNLWIGHQGQGLSIMNLYSKEFNTFRKDPISENSLISNIITCFNGTNEEIMIGSRTGGLNVMKRMGYSYNAKPNFRNILFDKGSNTNNSTKGIWSIAKESDSLFWVGTDIGLLKLLKYNGVWHFDQSEPPIYTGIVRVVFIDNNKNIWCGTWNDGLIFIPAQKNNPRKDFYRFYTDLNDKESLSDNFVQCITLDSKGRFWIGTVNGLNLLKVNYENLDLSGNTKPTVKFHRYLAERKATGLLNNNEINCIYENIDGKIWLATQGGGINIIDPDTGLITYMTSTEGLPSNIVLGILRDENGSIWITTNKGLVSKNIYKSNSDLRIYTFSDGIQGDIFMVNSFYKTSDGELFFGGDNGFTCFYPNHIKTNFIKPKVEFTNMRFGQNIINIGDTIYKSYILDKHINYKDKIVLPFVRNSFNVGVSALHFQHPLGNKISYTLEGFFDRWITQPASWQYVYLSNIPTGKYILKVKAISSDNIESENLKCLALEILPPWYKTWYMRLIFIILIISIIGYLMYILISRQRYIYKKEIDKLTLENNENQMIFLTNIAHELRTPLSLVIAPINDIVQNYKTIDIGWKNHLSLIYRNSNYLLKLINQIVDFRKLNAGKLTLSPQNIDIVKLVNDVVQNFKYLEDHRHVNLSIVVPASKIIISVDSQKIEAVLYNLLSNAFKHTADNKSIIITIAIIITEKFQKNPGTQSQMKISVFNEGKDISNENKSKIFERFYKADESVEGAGIGLSFSKSLVELHNGSINVESVDGKGVSFNVYLPYTENLEEQSFLDDNTFVDENIVVNKINGTFQHVGTKENEKSISLVIVEDNDDLRIFLKNVLSRQYNCFEAKDGVDGWNIIKEIIPDIIISDIIMPRKDGYQLCKQVKENIKTCHIPVILLTAKNTDGQIISGYNIGADAYVTKPFDMNLVLSQISRLIKNRELIKEKYITQNFMVEVPDSIPSKDDKFIIRIRSLLEDNISDAEFNVQKLSTQLNISTTQLYRKLKSLTGYSPVEFIKVVKLQKAYNLLNVRNNTVKEVCYLSGFNNLSYFIKCFREQFGVTPASFRDNGFTEDLNNDNTNQTNMPELNQDALISLE